VTWLWAGRRAGGWLQACNMVYGIRDQSPKFCLELGSEARDRGSQRWDWESRRVKFGDRLRDQGSKFLKKWAQGSKLSKNSRIIKTKIYHVTMLWVSAWVGEWVSGWVGERVSVWANKKITTLIFVYFLAWCRSTEEEQRWLHSIRSGQRRW